MGFCCDNVLKLGWFVLSRSEAKRIVGSLWPPADGVAGSNARLDQKDGAMMSVCVAAFHIACKWLNCVMWCMICGFCVVCIVWLFIDRSEIKCYLAFTASWSVMYTSGNETDRSVFKHPIFYAITKLLYWLSNWYILTIYYEPTIVVNWEENQFNTTRVRFVSTVFVPIVINSFTRILHLIWLYWGTSVELY